MRKETKAQLSVRDKFRHAKREAKLRFADRVKRTHWAVLDPASIFDCQVKRIHEYKRQLLNVPREIWGAGPCPIP